MIAEATSLAVFFGVGSGWGRLLPDRYWTCSAAATAAGSYLVGFLVFAALYACAAELHAPFAAALGVSIGFVLCGVVGIARAARRDPRRLVWHAAIGAMIGGYWLTAGAITRNEGAVDPWFYAASPFVFFHWDWLDWGMQGLANAQEVSGILQVIALTRASATAVLWPIALLGDGLRVRHVVEAGVGLLLVAWLITADLVRPTAPRVAAAVLGLGGIGVYNGIAILSGGQVQQSVALCATLACLWLCRQINSQLVSLLAFVLTGFLVATTYPEFLLVLPLSVAVLALVRRQRAQTTALQVAAALVGFGLELLVSGNRALVYLATQSVEAPNWSPIPTPPSSVLDVLIDLTLQSRPPAWGFGLALLAAALFWLRPTDEVVENPARSRHIVLLLFGAFVVWGVALGRSPKLDYAVFKLGGWIGPGLLVLVWFLASGLRRDWRRLAHAGLAALAVTRAVALIYGAGGLLLAERPELASRWPRQQATDGTCFVEVDQTDAYATVSGIAASAAPFHGCILVNAPGGDAAMRDCGPACDVNSAALLQVSHRHADAYPAA